MTITIRPATADDEAHIKRLIHEVRINPTGLDWRRFLVAEEDGQFVGCGQLKPHNDEVLELASLAVRLSAQSKGIGSLLVKALIESAPGTLYLMCVNEMAPYYQRFGFEVLAADDMPRPLKTYYRAGKIFAKLAGQSGISIMRRHG